MDTRTLEIGNYDSLSDKLKNEGLTEKGISERLIKLNDSEYDELKNMNRKQRRQWMKRNGKFKKNK